MVPASVGIDDFSNSHGHKPNGGHVPKELSTKAQKEAKAALINYQSYARARDNGHMDYVRDAKKFDEFYRGEQWDDKDLAKLKEAGRPALTVNKILPTINTILGEQASREADLKFLPVKQSSPDTARTLNKLYLQIKNSNNLTDLEAEVFADGIIQERGFFDVRMDFETNILGDIRVTHLDPLDVWIDPDAKEYDPATWNEVGVSRWMSPDEIKAEFGDEAYKKVKDAMASNPTLDFDAFRLESTTFGGDLENRVEVYFDDSKRVIKSVRVIDRQYVQYKRCLVFIDPIEGDVEQVPPEWEKEKAQEFADRMGLYLTYRTQKKIRWTVSAANNILIHDDWSPYETFTIIPFFPIFRRGSPIGMVRNLISPQEQLNKIQSQILHVVNTTANSGYIVEQGTLVNMSVDELKNRGSETGLVIETAPGRRDGIDKIKPNQIPTGLDSISQQASHDIKEISAINDAMLGAVTSGKVSGVALEARKQSASLQLEKAFKNLAKTRNLLAKKLLELIQGFYTEERAYTISNEIDPDQAPEQLVINEQLASGEVVNNVTLGKYDVVVSSQPARENYAQTQFAHALEMRGIGVAIPDDTLVELSPIDGKHEIAERMRKLMGTAEPTEQEMQIAQIQQELAMRAQQAELGKLEAEVQNMMADAQLKLAKAQNEGSENARLLEELEFKIQQKREELQLRKDLALLSAGNKERIAALNAQTKLTESYLDKLETTLEEAKTEKSDAPSR